jgi:hypothetical protein
MANSQSHERSLWIRQPGRPGRYISADGRFTAELRPPGFYADLNSKLQRHYAIRAVGSVQIIGTATTLADAARRYGVRGDSG